MGEGVYHDRHGRTRLVSNEDWVHEGEENTSMEYALLVEAIREALTDAFWPCREWLHDHRGVAIVAKSKLFCIDVHEDSYGTIAITVRPRTDLEPSLEALAGIHLDRMASAVFIKLAERYPLRIRTSGWTTGEAPEHAAAA